MFAHPVGKPFRFVQSIYVHIPAVDWPDCGICAVKDTCDWLPYKPCKKCNRETYIAKLVDCPMGGHCKLIMNKYHDTHVTTFNFREIQEAMLKDIADYKIKPRR